MTVLEYLVIALVIVIAFTGLLVLLSITNIIQFPHESYSRTLYSILIVAILLLVLYLFGKALFMYNQNSAATDECAKANPPFWCSLGP